MKTAARKGPTNIPAGDFLWVWYDDQSPGEPDGFIVAQHRRMTPDPVPGWLPPDDGEPVELVAELVEILAVFPPLDHPERAKPSPRLDASRFRVSANAWARKEAEMRNLPVWTAAAGKGGR